MPYLIDGHNLIGALADISLNDPHKEAKLVAQLKVFLRRQGKRGVVIYDGGQPAGRSQWSSRELQVIFAAHHTSADQLIVQRLQRERQPAGWIVVSSDGAVGQAAQQRGAQIRSAQAFAQLMKDAASSPAAREQGLRPDEVEDWLNLFGSGDEKGNLGDN